jgi:hypothetical protein
MILMTAHITSNSNVNQATQIYPREPKVEFIFYFSLQDHHSLSIFILRDTKLCGTWLKPTNKNQQSKYAQGSTFTHKKLIEDGWL